MSLKYKIIFPMQVALTYPFLKNRSGYDNLYVFYESGKSPRHAIYISRAPYAIMYVDLISKTERRALSYDKRSILVTLIKDIILPNLKRTDTVDKEVIWYIKSGDNNTVNVGGTELTIDLISECALSMRIDEDGDIIYKTSKLINKTSESMI